MTQVSLSFKNARATIEFMQFDKDEELEIEMEVNDYFQSIWLNKEDVQQLINHLQKQIDHV